VVEDEGAAMIRVRIEMVPRGDESRAYPLGLIEIANLSVSAENVGEYAVVLKKTAPYTGALQQAWRRGRFSERDGTLADVEPLETEELVVARVGGHHRTRRGVYDLVYRALRACGLEARNPS
jgi:hypothetical protein